MSALSVYLAEDRLHALAYGETLPDRTHGAALFADVSGFTSLTESLTQRFGARRGIEELTQRMNAVYDALIGEVGRYGGSVISFAGDAITCWFDAAAERASLRAVATACAMQQATRMLSDLSLKVAVTGGTVRRFVVGDPQIQFLDTLAGQTITRLATAEHLALKGDVIVDTATLETCGAVLQIGQWRHDADTLEPFAVIISSAAPLESALTNTSAVEVPAETLRVWVPSTVYAREQSRLGEFLTELRPAEGRHGHSLNSLWKLAGSCAQNRSLALPSEIWEMWRSNRMTTPQLEHPMRKACKSRKSWIVNS